jgi:hypothetical protein
MGVSTGSTRTEVFVVLVNFEWVRHLPTHSP